MMDTITVQLPLELPSGLRLEELIREAAVQVAKEQLGWLSFEQAAERWGVSFRTFERKKAKLGLPVSIIDGVKRIWIEDLDAALRAAIKDPKVNVIAWPSAALREDDKKRRLVA